MAKLEGKVALVTGSGRGIGRAIALKLAREGAKLLVNDLDEEVGSSVADEIRRAGGQARAVNGDVCDARFADRFVSAALAEFGGIDIIVNNAGYVWDAAIHKTSDEQIDAMLAVHLEAPMRLLRSAAAPLRELAEEDAVAGREVFRKIVNISSVSGMFGNPGQASYASAKAGLIGLTKTLSKEWGRFKINVNCVAFGLIDTRLTSQDDDTSTIDIAGRDIRVGFRGKTRDALLQQIPVGRSGRADEAADAVYLFCSPESNYISGQIVACAGGLSF